MALIIVGLGNPGKEYEKTRHNAGRSAVELLAKQEGASDFIFNKKANALVAQGKNMTFILPETMMNASGKAVSAFIPAGGGPASGGKSKKVLKNLLVIHDDLDLPLGTIKMVFARGSGGHKGVESVMRAIRTDAFARIRIGISGVGKKNQAKKVSGDEKVLKHVIGKWKPGEEAVAKKAIKKAAEAARLFAAEGLSSAIQFANTR